MASRVQAWVVLIVVAAVGLLARAGVPADPTPVPLEALPPLTPADLVQRAPFNVDFKSGPVGQAPTGWAGFSTGYEAKVVDEGPEPGSRAVKLTPVRGGAMAAAGDLYQVLSGGMFAGKVVEFSAMVRVEPAPGPVTAVPGQAQLVLRVDRMMGQVGLFRNMSDRPIVSRTWKRYTLSGRVEADGAQVNVGVLALGGATVYLADVRIRAIDNVPEDLGNIGPTPLEGRELENISAWGRLWGLLRWFHPSDQSLDTDWDTLLMAGIDHVAKAKDAAELARALSDLTEPIAPGVAVYPTAGPEPAPPEQPAASPSLRLVGWRHTGLAGNVALSPSAAQIYKTERVVLPLVDATSGEKIPKPLSLTVAKLPGQVTARVPLVLFMDEKGTLPHAGAGARALPSIQRPDGWSESLQDRTVRLAAVIFTWNVIEHFYPYQTVVRVDWPAMLEPALQRAAVATNTHEALNAVRELLAGARDGHGQVVHAEDPVLAIMPLGWTFVGDDLIITRVLGEQLQQFIRPGDRVVAIDGTTVRAAADEVRPLVSAANPGRASIGVAQGLRTVFPKYMQTKVRLEREGDPERPEPFDVAITRVRTNIDLPPESDWVFENRERRPPNGSELAPGVLYFDLCGMSRPDLMRALPAMAAAKGLVFDVRGYPADGAYELLRHLTTKPIQSGKWTIPIVTFPDRPERAFSELPRWQITPAQPALGTAAGMAQKVAFVTDARAISYAESILGIVEAEKLGQIVGEPTAGTNGNVNPFRVPGGAIVYFTGMRVLKHNDMPNHIVGILPTIPASRTRAGIAAGRDEMLEAAARAVMPSP